MQSPRQTSSPLTFRRVAPRSISADPGVATRSGTSSSGEETSHTEPSSIACRLDDCENDRGEGTPVVRWLRFCWSSRRCTKATAADLPLLVEVEAKVGHDDDAAAAVAVAVAAAAPMRLHDSQANHGIE